MLPRQPCTSESYRQSTSSVKFSDEHLVLTKETSRWPWWTMFAGWHHLTPSRASMSTEILGVCCRGFAARTRKKSHAAQSRIGFSSPVPVGHRQKWDRKTRDFKFFKLFAVFQMTYRNRLGIGWYFTGTCSSSIYILVDCLPLSFCIWHRWMSSAGEFWVHESERRSLRSHIRSWSVEIGGRRLIVKDGASNVPVVLK